MEYIRFLRETEKLSLSEIVRTTNTTWRTAKKYADGQATTQKGPRQRRRARVLKDAYREALETWILEDERRPRKHRRTAQALYNQLVEEKGYRGSSRTVRDCVKEMRAQLVREETTHLSLDHRPGVAQVDFGVTLTVIAGEEAHERVVHKLVMTFPYSNDALTRHLPAENTECLLEGLRSMFEELGGVPRDIWFDNLSAAVKDVLQGEQRTLNRLFSEFSWHYKFKSTFCNPGRAHEKGAVENKVGTLRRNCDSPPQRIEQLSELDERAAKERARRRGQRHYKKLIPISELFEEDRRSLLVLPEIPCTVSNPDTAVVSKTGEVKIRKELYHIPGASIRQKVFARVFAYHIDF
jgi:transposase